MAGKIYRLTAAQVQKSNKQAWLNDGNGLYLQISKGLSKSWVFRFKEDGKEHRMGLGSFPAISLTEARELAAAAKKLQVQGINPLNHKRSEAIKKKTEQGKLTTFKEAASRFIKTKSVEWSSSKHKQQWENTLKAYAYPLIGDIPVNLLTTEHILQVLEPVWNTKTETASRVRQRIELVIDWAISRGLRIEPNPARWKGHLSHQLPSPAKIHKVKHHRYTHYSEIPSVYKNLRGINSTAARALRFLILSALRSSEGRGLLWQEISEDTIDLPPERMKRDAAHRLPKTNEINEILKEQWDSGESGEHLVFQGQRENRPISDTTLMNLLKELDIDTTIHGLRSAFRTWGAEQTNFSKDVLEQALHHETKTPVEASYNHSDLFIKRQKLMTLWESYLTSPKGKSKITQIKKVATNG